MSNNIDINKGNKEELGAEDFMYSKDKSATEDYVYNISDGHDIVVEPNMQNEDNFVNQLVDLNISDCVDKEVDTNIDLIDFSSTEDYIDIEKYSNIEDNSNTEHDSNIKDLSDIENLLYIDSEQNADENSITKEILVQKEKVNRQDPTSAKHNLPTNNFKHTLPTDNLNIEDISNLENDSNSTQDPNAEDATRTNAIDISVSSKNYLDEENSVNTKHIPNLDKESNEDNVFNEQDGPKNNLFDTNDPIVQDLLSPDIYIDENELLKSSIGNDSEKSYSIDGFWYIEKKSPPDKDWVQFEVYAEGMENNLLAASGTEFGASYYSSSDSDSTENEDIPSSDVEFDLTLRKVARGYLINEQIFLTEQQWNTVTLEKLETYHCSVCNMMCDFKKHVGTLSHKYNLEIYKPLEKYELHMIRKIRNVYHCAICNKVIDNPQAHRDTEPHGDNMRYAINKVFDIEYVQSKHNESDQQKDSYHYDANALNNYMRMNSDEHETCEENDEDYNTPAYPSYASMAKKPKGPELPEYIVQDLGNTTVTVKHDSWHMIITIKIKNSNKLYCIVCKKYIKMKARHCSDTEHLRKLKQCSIVEKYINEYFIRMVDGKFYHCGHCNNLQYINDMDDHIETQHLRRSKHTLIDINSTIHNTEVKNKIEGEVVYVNGKSKKRNSSASGREPNVNVYITLCLFNRTFLVSNLSYHMIKPFDYYCGFCNKTFTETSILYHIMYDQIHLLRLSSTAFLNLFHVHLVRMLKDSYHCAICNMVIQYQYIYIHLNTVAHLINLEIAIGIRPPPMLQPIPNDPSNPYYHQSNEAYVILKQETPIPNVTPNTNELTPKKTSAAKKKTSAAKKKTSAAKKMTSASDKTSDTSEKATREAYRMADITEQVAKLPQNTNVMEKTQETIEKSKVAIEKLKEAVEKTKNFIEKTTDVTEKMTKAKENMTKADKTSVSDDEANLLNESTTTEEDSFDTEECILAKINNNVLKITNSAYNSLTPMGSGSKYCFVCAMEVRFSELMNHVNSRSHIEAMEGCKFLSNIKYDGNLLRQSFLLYHCAVCNILFSRDELDDHLFWLTHMDELNSAQNNAKYSKTTGMTQITVCTTDEILYLNQSKPKLRIHLDVEIVCANENESDACTPKSKVVFFKEHVLKIDWRTWHGLTKYPEDSFFCKMCTLLVPSVDLNDHLRSNEHMEKLNKPLLDLDNGLIRQMTPTSFLCIICCSELKSMKGARNHVQSRKHTLKWNILIKESKQIVSYEGCEEYDGVFI